MFVSSDFGSTWTLTWTLTTNFVFRLAYDSTGQYMAASGYSNGVYTSSDYGRTWNMTSAPSKGSYAWISMSSDGKTIVTADAQDFSFLNFGGGGLWASSNRGSTWTEIA